MNPMSKNQYENFKLRLQEAEDAGATSEQMEDLKRFANKDKWDSFYSLHAKLVPRDEHGRVIKKEASNAS